MDDHPALYSVLLGLLVVVFVGIGMSRLADWRFNDTKERTQLRKQVEASTEELESLRYWLRDKAAYQNAREANCRRIAEKLHTTSLELDHMKLRRSALQEVRKDTVAAITELNQQFEIYRKDYRIREWESAKGEPIGDLRGQGGRLYQNAVIVRVTEAGLEIRHEHGLARVPAAHLSVKLENRFQWSSEDRRRKLEEESDNPRTITLAKKVVKKMAGGSKHGPDAAQKDIASDPVEVERLQETVAEWMLNVSKLKSERTAALFAAEFDSSVSTPGSLAEWKAKASRLGMELSAARRKLTAASESLRAVAPDDPLLTATKTK